MLEHALCRCRHQLGHHLHGGRGVRRPQHGHPTRWRLRTAAVHVSGVLLPACRLSVSVVIALAFMQANWAALPNTPSTALATGNFSLLSPSILRTVVQGSGQWVFPKR